MSKVRAGGVNAGARAGASTVTTRPGDAPARTPHPRPCMPFPANRSQRHGICADVWPPDDETEVPAKESAKGTGDA
jgi:hypothetical protein